ncbi:MAG: hypothetical protein ABF679_11625 [Lentilactobacillus diolivorans]|uniref:hypothetical protein n=1 Tax=Lentilactobacillus diolivorans TaxID=179838 RepID=UPI0024683732|nr:hypothetical protein [Lentilactobacillus diolivorans]MDH5105578.1 hypothetical protein [Lentilactobacillus diolivorans]
MKFNWNYTFVANSPLAILWAFVMIDGLVLTMTPVNLLLAIGITGIVWLIYYLLFERNYFRSHPLFNPQNQKAGKAASLVTILGAWLSLVLFFLTRNALLIFSLLILTNFIRDGFSIPKHTTQEGDGIK